MYNMHKESRSGNKKNEQFYERSFLYNSNIGNSKKEG